jgi:hypothetical protein
MGNLNYFALALVKSFITDGKKIRGKILDEFVAVKIYHRKDATCNLSKGHLWQNGKMNGLTKDI